LGIWEQSSQPPEARRSESGASIAGRFLQSLNAVKITHFYAYFGQNSYFKAISLIKSV